MAIFGDKVHLMAFLTRVCVSRALLAQYFIVIFYGISQTKRKEKTKDRTSFFFTLRMLRPFQVLKKKVYITFEV